ncbi:MAG: MFS transporter [Acidimicrobiales bacterium]
MIADDPPVHPDPGPVDPAGGHAGHEVDDRDPRRWITLAIVLTSVLIAALDSTVLNVAIPTILREFDTTLPALQWVVTGYSLTFAALLIIGGRLGDIFGARRMFIVGLALFGLGSLLASLANGVVTLVIGEAIIEGAGASFMLPATMGIMSSTFVGRERATAFAAWGAVMGAAVAFGPLLGGFLTTNYSWRWAFRINVIVAPLAIIGALVFMRRSLVSGRRERLDVPGALLISTGMFLLVFGISEGGTYGWLQPLQSLEIAGAGLWPMAMPLSVVPVSFLLAAIVLTAFYVVQRRKERADADPLFEFSNLEHPAFRYGIATLMVLAMGQVSFLLIMSVVLQDGRHLSAVDTGLWLVPSGIAIVVGSQIGSWLTRRIGTTNVVRCGLIIEAGGLAAIAVAVSGSLTFASLLPGFALFGVGIGFAGSQLNNVILADVPSDRAGATSGANTTVRMLGSALGIAVISTLLTRAGLDTGAVHGAAVPLIFSTVVVSVGALLSFRIPQVGPLGSRQIRSDEVRLAVEESELMAESVATQ